MKTKLKKKQLSLVVSILLVLTAVIGGTLAYLVTHTDSVNNSFTSAEVTCHVDEKFSSNLKKDVKIENTGDTEAYIRAAVIVTWQDENGNIAAKPVNDTDYQIALNYKGNEGSNSNNNTEWIKGYDGYYYYSEPVAVNNSTGYLIGTCSLAENVTAPVGYHLCVEIIADAVQSKPAQAVIDAWSTVTQEITVGENGKLIIAAVSSAKSE